MQSNYIFPPMSLGRKMEENEGSVYGVYGMQSDLVQFSEHSSLFPLLDFAQVRDAAVAHFLWFGSASLGFKSNSSCRRTVTMPKVFKVTYNSYTAVVWVNIKSLTEV